MNDRHSCTLWKNWFWLLLVAGRYVSGWCVFLFTLFHGQLFFFAFKRQNAIWIVMHVAQSKPFSLSVYVHHAQQSTIVCICMVHSHIFVCDCLDFNLFISRKWICSIWFYFYCIYETDGSIQYISKWKKIFHYYCIVSHVIGLHWLTMNTFQWNTIFNTGNQDRKLHYNVTHAPS